jgi:uncharacterized protein (TIGR00288 family)
MKSHRVGEGERSLAVFIDFENMGLGFNNRRDKFEINKVLERLVEKGKIVCKKAYADWSRFGMYTGALHEAAIELIEIPRRGMSGKNSADIRLVVDAIDLAYSKDHIDTFVIVSGDSDFSPLVSKLKELGKHVIGLGLVDATSDLLRDNCDEFIYYEDLDRAPIIPVTMNEQIPDRKRKVFALLLDSLLALRRENKEVIYSSMLKDTIKRKKPSFNEEYYGYRTFSELLEDAQREGLLEIDKHKSSGMYVVTRFGLELQTGSGVVPMVRNGNGRVADAPKVVTLPSGATLGPKVVTLPGNAVVPPALPPAKSALSGREPSRGRGPAPERPPITRPAPPPAARIAPSTTPLEEDEPTPPMDRPLGRALAEEVDDLDDEPLDEVPSYAPAKPAAKAAGRPAPKSGVKPAAKPTAKPEAKPRGRSTPAAKPAAPARGSRAAEPPPPRRKPEPKPVEPPKPAPKPAKPPSDDDEFGAGIGE